MGKIREVRCRYEYVSDNGIVYEIGENGAEFNIIIDTFMDLDEKFEGLTPFNPHLVDFVCGDIEEEDVLEWIDERIERYENHERKVQFFTNHLCECYIGLKERKSEPIERWSKERFFANAKSI
jgi:NAD(P)H-nitrite reductase large subunit